jgi:hypothetical protein
MEVYESPGTDLALEQVGNPHDRYCSSLVRGPLYGVLGTGPDVILLGHKLLAILHEGELALRDVTDHGILHRIRADGAAGLENNVTQCHLGIARDHCHSLPKAPLLDTLGEFFLLPSCRFRTLCPEHEQRCRSQSER